MILLGKVKRFGRFSYEYKLTAQYLSDLLSLTPISITA